ncbi:MAG: hypothetical protein L0Y72_24155 [Gemmataceae bacterium]|nr:hypothetical protein [Gemmataceae bacterium]MCI0742139.1 hypothetical protein [Gemmataceae bacterium]
MIVLVVLCSSAFAEDKRKSSVGLPARIDQIVLPGTELEVKKLDDRKLPVVLRIVNVFPHGTAHRYDLVYYGLDPGTFDLRDYLKRKDGSSMADLPALPVEIKAILPPGQIEPNKLETQSGPWLGGYRLMLIVGGVLWVGGLAAILLVGRKRRAELARLASRPVTLADRLRPLVEEARTGTLSTAQRAELERLLLTFWQRRLGLEDAKPHEAFATLKKHPDAGPLIRQLEVWLHCPAPADSFDVGALLRPYADIAG